MIRLMNYMRIKKKIKYMKKQKIKLRVKKVSHLSHIYIKTNLQKILIVIFMKEI